MLFSRANALFGITRVVPGAAGSGDDGHDEKPVAGARLSSDRELHDHEELLRRYGVGVLPKPFDLDALLEKVAAGLASRAD